MSKQDAKKELNDSTLQKKTDAKKILDRVPNLHPTPSGDAKKILETGAKKEHSVLIPICTDSPTQLPSVTGRRFLVPNYSKGQL